MHRRTIQCDGYERDDGLWDIESRIVDVKSYEYEEQDRGVRAPGAHMHDMTIRLTLDPTYVVQAVETSMDSHPYGECAGAAPQFQGLVGSRIGPGWRKVVADAVGGTKGCTHMREMLAQMATVAFQTMSGWRKQSPEERARSSGQRPYFVDGCRAWAADGGVVARHYPSWSIRKVD